MPLFLDDGDVRLYHGDALEQLASLPPTAVHMVATSPPFYGLRDYGTGTWEGGDAACDHEPRRWEGPKQTQGAQSGHASKADRLARKECPCGARRVDRQIGLEESPDEWVDRLVAVFEECRLADSTVRQYREDVA